MKTPNQQVEDQAYGNEVGRLNKLNRVADAARANQSGNGVMEPKSLQKSEGP